MQKDLFKLVEFKKHELLFLYTYDKDHSICQIKKAFKKNTDMCILDIAKCEAQKKDNDSRNWLKLLFELPFKTELEAEEKTDLKEATIYVGHGETILIAPPVGVMHLDQVSVRYMFEDVIE